MTARIGVDLGGTKIEVAVLDPAGHFLLRERLATPREDYDATLEAIATLVDRTITHCPPSTPVGIGMPGAISPATGLVKNANSTWLNGRPLAEDIGQRLGRRVRLQNDANCLAVSESIDGAAAGAGIVFAVILGTGVGGGIAINGRVLTGAHAIAGEWGHNPLPWPTPDEYPGPACWCGRQGCAEAWLSGPALAAQRAAARDAIAAQEAAAGDTGRGAGARAATVSGEPTSAEARVLDRHADRLARGLAAVTNLLDPEVIVLGGGVSNLPGLAETVEARLPAWAFSDRVEPRVRRALHGDSSGVRGAAWLWHPDEEA